jgi:hypothetical protein
MTKRLDKIVDRIVGKAEKETAGLNATQRAMVLLMVAKLMSVTVEYGIEETIRNEDQKTEVLVDGN